MNTATIILLIIANICFWVFLMLIGMSLSLCFPSFILAVIGGTTSTLGLLYYRYWVVS